MARVISAVVVAVAVALLIAGPLLADADVARLEDRAEQARYQPADLRGPDFPDGQDRVVVRLPSRFGAFRVGGGGRHYIFHCPDRDQLVIVDLFKRAVARTIDAPDDDLRFAAGREHLFVAARGKLERYVLHTLVRDRSVDLPDRRPPASMKMGADGHDLLVRLPAAGGRTRFYDTDRLTPSREAPPEFDDLENCRLSSSGQYLATPAGALFRMDHTGIFQAFSVRGPHAPGTSFQPSADGRFILHGSDLTQRTGRQLAAQPDDARLIPSLDPRYAWAVHAGPQGDAATLLAIHDATPLVTLNGLEPIAGPSGGEPRLWHVPSNNAIVLIPTTDDRVVFRRFNGHVALEATGKPYLFVQSLPPTVVQRGQTLHYGMDVVAKLKPLAYDVEKGPEGMTVSPAGHVSWPCPPDYARDDVNVVIRVRDASGAVVRHAFTILTPSRETLDAPLRPDPAADPVERAERVAAVPTPSVPPAPTFTPPATIDPRPVPDSPTVRGVKWFLFLVVAVVTVIILVAIAVVRRAAPRTYPTIAGKLRRTCPHCHSTFDFSPTEATTQRFCPHCGHPA